MKVFQCLIVDFIPDGVQSQTVIPDSQKD